MIPALERYKELERQFPDMLELSVEGTVGTPGDQFPVYSFRLGRKFTNTAEGHCPTLLLCAGVHGLEAIGVKVLLSFVEHILAQSKWNSSIHSLLHSIKIVGLPLLNPTGYFHLTRANSRGVDLMRNAPVESHEAIPFLGGHRFSSSLPYYRGKRGLEPESEILIRQVESALETSPFVLSVDFHSGFGFEDSLWTPYAKTTKEPPHMQFFSELKRLLDSTLPHHVYTFERQSNAYCTHGDLWDFLYDRQFQSPRFGNLLPLTLELGSWTWVRKSPLSFRGLWNLFNPVHPHRESRVLRRHLPLLMFLSAVVQNNKSVFRRFERASVG